MAHKREHFITVRIVAGAVLWHEGRAFYEVHELSVSVQDMKALEQAGTADRVKKA